MNPTTIEIIATTMFALAVCHTFLVSKFERLAHKYPVGSIGENFFHFLAEVEVVFGLWGGLFLAFYSALEGFLITDEHHKVIGGTIHYLEQINFTEAAFVFVVMSIAATRPILILSEKAIFAGSKILPLPQKMAFYVTTLTLGPILGSFITEPAAMTVTALVLLDKFYNSNMSRKFKYATIGLLFVNISIGGTLTNFAAPPVLMVAGKWNWGISDMIALFGYKAVVAIFISTAVITMIFRKELQGNVKIEDGPSLKAHPPLWITLSHLFSLAIVVVTAHHMTFFLGYFLFFLGFCDVTEEYQDQIKLKESLLVGFFLGGLVTLGNLQAWWLGPLIGQLSDFTLFSGSTALTAITDNAALTYLGSLVELSDSAKFNLVAGAVTGGGLTVIANAPNPAGFGILKHSFGESGISPLGLLASALFPTIVAAICFQILP